jgi:hypothetical protein
MLNFLITVFSETHENVLANKINYIYLTRATLNVECLAMLKTFGIIQDFDYFVICSPVDDKIEGEVDTLGVITCLTSVIKENSIKIGTKINQIKTEIKTEINQIKTEIKAQNTEMSALNGKIDKLIQLMIEGKQ